MTSRRQFEGLAKRLRDHFYEVTICPPASDSAIQRLQEHIPGVPELVVDFYRFCDGIRVGVKGGDEGYIFGVEEALRVRSICEGLQRLGRLLPIRGDGCGNNDCIVTGPGKCEGAVVFWDHEVYDSPAYLLGGSLFSYLDMWADRLTHEFFRNGQSNPEYVPPQLDSWPFLGKPNMRHPWPFDEKWLRERDPTADQLLGDEQVRGWFSEQDELDED